jgi:3-isopropylmalate/(R)-2-methylmalate dehydratase large subunit
MYNTFKLFRMRPLSGKPDQIHQMSQTLFDKLWQAHEVRTLDNGESLLLIDRIFLHERTGAVALMNMAETGREVRHPDRVFCTMDHIVDTHPGRGDDTLMPGGRAFIEATREAAQAANITLFDIHHPSQGIMHVVSPELGIALPGLTMVCPDSHTCTLGGLGALAWGIGSTDAEHAMVTGTLRLRKPSNMRVSFDGLPSPDITAKDMALHLIAQLGSGAGNGCAVEFDGPAIAALDVEARMTLCNMAVEFSAFTALVAPDQKTRDYALGRPYSPEANLEPAALAYWESLYSDDEASFDQEVRIDSSAIQPSVTWGTSPQHTVPLDGCVPHPDRETNPERRAGMLRALEYMNLRPGTPMESIAINAAFIGSCTNARLSDLRQAAQYLKGRHVADGVRAVCVPGSSSVKRAAEAEGLDRIFTAAGFEWRESGCSMCLYAGGETFGQGSRIISSTNRNFEGRQGPGTRTHLASPLTVAASACSGHLARAWGQET